MTEQEAITQLIQDCRKGDAEASQKLIAAAYKELRRLAQTFMRHERSNHTLQATALVNEAYVRLVGQEKIEFQDRAHFFAVLANQMRFVLVDHARKTRAAKRGGAAIKLSLDEVYGLGEKRDEEILLVHEALSRLEKLDPKAARVIELRFFGGLTEKEAAQALGVSVATLKRDWVFARSWLFTELT
jgi:RNA polymerase sigma factor (TIGR02999 family)